MKDAPASRGRKESDENYQMSEDWNKDRLSRGGYSGQVTNFSRHVLFFGAVAIAEHSVALAKNPKAPNEAEHRHHNATWLANSADIDQTISDKKERARKRGKK